MFDYNPQTGVIRWKINHRPRAVAGAQAGHAAANGYRTLSYGGKCMFAHRVAFELMGVELGAREVDHINGNRSDNRWANLRPATCQQNQWNKAGYSKRGMPKGVRPVRGGYVAFIKPPNFAKSQYLGYFKDIDKAAFMYACAAETLFGAFAYGREGNRKV